MTHWRGDKEDSDQWDTSCGRPQFKGQVSLLLTIGPGGPSGPGGPGRPCSPCTEIPITQLFLAPAQKTTRFYK